MAQIVNLSRNMTVAKNVTLAMSFFRRFCGLMMRPAIKCDEAMLFYNAPGIHTFFMRFSLDLVFLDKKMKVMRIDRGVKPWRMIFCPGSAAVVEFLGGSTDGVLGVGDVIEVKNG